MAEKKELSNYKVANKLGLCGCGNPTSVHLFVIKFLQLRKDFASVDEMVNFIKENSEVVCEFVLHILNRDDIEFLNHGSSIWGSFLDDLGKKYLEIFKDCKTEEDIENKLEELEFEEFGVNFNG